MNQHENEGLKSILELRSIIEKVFFKEFQATYEFPFSLNHTHIRTMMMLNFEGDKPMSLVSDKLNLEKGSFTPVATNLIEHGYIIKIPDSKDKRVFHLSLTDKGRVFSTEFCHKHNTYVNELLEVLTEDEKKSYFMAIQTINNLTNKIQNNKVN